MTVEGFQIGCPGDFSIVGGSDNDKFKPFIADITATGNYLGITSNMDALCSISEVRTGRPIVVNSSIISGEYNNVNFSFLENNTQYVISFRIGNWVVASQVIYLNTQGVLRIVGNKNFNQQN